MNKHLLSAAIVGGLLCFASHAAMAKMDPADSLAWAKT